MKFSKNYLIVRESEVSIAIYDCSYTPRKLLTYNSSWQQATVTAKLLSDAYKNGYKARELNG